MGRVHTYELMTFFGQPLEVSQCEGPGGKVYSSSISENNMSGSMERLVHTFAVNKEAQNLEHPL